MIIVEPAHCSAPTITSVSICTDQILFSVNMLTCPCLYFLGLMWLTDASLVSWCKVPFEEVELFAMADCFY